MGKKKKKANYQPDQAFWYKIPTKVLESFSDICIHNVDSNGSQVETLAILIGYKDKEDLVATEIVFPQQIGSSTHVEDKGT